VGATAAEQPPRAVGVLRCCSGAKLNLNRYVNKTKIEELDKNYPSSLAQLLLNCVERIITMAITYEEVLSLFKETDRKFQETDRKLADSDARLKAQLAEQAKQAEARAEARAAEFSAQLKESARLAEERALKNEQAAAQAAAKAAAEYKKQSAETNRKIKAVTAQIGSLGNRLGEWVEEMVRPAAVRLFRERNIDVHQVIKGAQVQRGDTGIEIDLMVVNDIEAVVIECKSQLTPQDVDDHLDRMALVKQMMPQYAPLKLMGAVAGMTVSSEVAAYAIRKGFYVIAPNGENVSLANPNDFKALAW
jgi:hypothetical protein